MNNLNISRTVANPENILLIRLDFYSRPCQRSCSDQEKRRKRGGTSTYGVRDASIGTDI